MLSWPRLSLRQDRLTRSSGCWRLRRQAGRYPSRALRPATDERCGPDRRGAFLAPPSRWHHRDLLRRPAAFTVVAYVAAGIATIGYLAALASGPAAVVVPMVATSPAVAGLAGIIFLHEMTSRQQLVGIALALTGGVLLAAQA